MPAQRVARTGPSITPLHNRHELEHPRIQLSAPEAVRAASGSHQQGKGSKTQAVAVPLDMRASKDTKKATQPAGSCTVAHSKGHGTTQDSGTQDSQSATRSAKRSTQRPLSSGGQGTVPSYINTKQPMQPPRQRGAPRSATSAQGGVSMRGPKSAYMQVGHRRWSRWHQSVAEDVRNDHSERHDSGRYSALRSSVHVQICAGCP